MQIIGTHPPLDHISHAAYTAYSVPRYHRECVTLIKIRTTTNRYVWNSHALLRQQFLGSNGCNGVARNWCRRGHKTTRKLFVA